MDIITVLQGAVAQIRQSAPIVSVELPIGQTYTITDFHTGDDFSNIAQVITGTINTNGCVFITTGAFAANWMHGSAIKKSLIPFYWGSQSQQNIKADKEDTTVGAIYLKWPIWSNNEITAAGTIQEKYPLIFLVFRQAPYNNTPQQDQPIIKDMTLIVNQFVKYLQTSKQFFPVFKFRVIGGVKLKDLGATGVVMEITLQPLIPIPLC